MRPVLLKCPTNNCALASAQPDPAEFSGDGRCIEVPQQGLERRRLEDRPVPEDIFAHDRPRDRRGFRRGRNRWNGKMHGLLVEVAVTET